jgi:hypothetical protein
VLHSGPAQGRCLQQWTIRGEVTLIGDPVSPVKLAGFYTACHDFFYASQENPPCPRARRVSSVSCLPSTGGDFLLAFDLADVSPGPGHYIYLILWTDANDNDVYDPGEEWRYVIPLYDDCVFQAATDCVCRYHERIDEATGAHPGWNRSIGLDRWAPMERSVLEGARLANEMAWSASAREEEEDTVENRGLDHAFGSGIDSPRLRATASPGD